MNIQYDGSFDHKEKKKDLQVPICPVCKKPLTQCKCKDNELKKGRK